MRPASGPKRSQSQFPDSIRLVQAPVAFDTEMTTDDLLCCRVGLLCMPHAHLEIRPLFAFWFVRALRSLPLTTREGFHAFHFIFPSLFVSLSLIRHWAERHCTSPHSISTPTSFLFF
jgi:hypothetical protein